MLMVNVAEELLGQKYEIENFEYLIDEAVLNDYKIYRHEVKFNSPVFSSIKTLGKSESCELTVFEVFLNEKQRDNRIKITQEMFRLLRKLHTNNAIVAFVNPDRKNYRISLLTSKYDFENGKIIKIYSSPHRYSYNLGVGTKTKTAYKFLIENGRANSLSELKNRFSIEVVNKQFYSEIATAFTALVGGERGGKTYEKALDLYNIEDKNRYAEFGVRLIGRIMFCRFLKEKRSKNSTPLVPDDMLSIEKVKKSQNYYHDVLEPLFFELLNTRNKYRKEELWTDYYNKIPYLNGGLFKPDPYDLYRNKGCTIPNDWFENFYKVLNEYNFTVDENTAYDVDLSIDPEMLGRIFENLLAEINPETGENAKKNTGSFYTPRDIVDYMVDSSVYKYLKNKTKIDELRLKALTSYSKEDDDIAVFSDLEKKEIVNALHDIKTCDIACGSGAFSIGMLQKIVYVLQEIDPDAELWFDKVTENVNPFIRREFEKRFNSGSLNYIRKLSVLQNSVFGVDIQPIAVEISRLRCFLSIIIEEEIHDEEENRGIKPLPNLDFKFIVADSLTKLDYSNGQMNFFEDQNLMERLKEIRENYFNAIGEERKDLELEFKDIQQDMLLKSSSVFGKDSSEKYKKLYSWKPFKNELTNWFNEEWMFGIKDGFDIIISNPPYIQLQKSVSENKKMGDIYKECGFKTFEKKGDIYCLFYERGYNLLKHGGILSFITSNKWMRAGYGKKLRELFSRKTNPLFLIDFMGTKVFETATVDVSILVLEKSENKGKTVAVIANAESRKDLSDYIQKHHTVVNFNTSENWTILSPIEQRIKEKIEKYGTPLKDWDIKINYGIKTGLNEAFIITGAKKDELIAEDPKSAEIIKPILRGRDIKKNGYNFADLYIITAIYNSHLYLEKQYPAVFKHLSKYEEKLKNRGQCKYLSSGKVRIPSDINYPGYPGMHHWLELDNNPRQEYLDEFSKPKIMYSEIVRKPQFFLDSEGFYPEATSFFMIGEHLDSLIKFLNSPVLAWIFKKYYAGGGLGESGYRYKKAFLINLPIPRFFESDKINDTCIYNLYHLDEEEIKYIENSLANN